MDKLYTFILDFKGGLYTSQISAFTIDNAIAKWVDKLHEEKVEIKFLGTKTINELKMNLDNNDAYLPVPLKGLINAWCLSMSTRKGILIVNIIETQQ